MSRTLPTSKMRVSFADLDCYDIAVAVTGVHSKLAGPAEGLVVELKAYLLGVWMQLVKNTFAEFPRLSARVLEEVSSAASTGTDWKQVCNCGLMLHRVSLSYSSYICGRRQLLSQFSSDLLAALLSRQNPRRHHHQPECVPYASSSPSLTPNVSVVVSATLAYCTITDISWYDISSVSCLPRWKPS